MYSTSESLHVFWRCCSLCSNLTACTGAQLFISDPENTRYLVKYRHVDAKLVLKVTDDKVCLKYKTDQSQDVKKMAGKSADEAARRAAYACP